MKKQRKHYTPEEKVAILRRHRLEQVPISELCENPSNPVARPRWRLHSSDPTAATCWQALVDVRRSLMTYVSTRLLWAIV
jgi:hypothetical protein